MLHLPTDTSQQDYVNAVEGKDLFRLLTCLYACDSFTQISLKTTTKKPGDLPGYLLKLLFKIIFSSIEQKDIDQVQTPCLVLVALELLFPVLNQQALPL